MHSRSFLFALPLLVGLGLFFASSHLRSEPAPDWQGKDLNGKTVQFSDFKGKVVILNFWATWCPPCIAEIPDFIALQKKYQGKGIAIVGMSVDSVPPAEVAAFVKKAGINYPILMATDEVTAKYDADGGIPVTYLIDRNGNIVFKHLGIIDPSDVKTRIDKLLSAPVTP